MAQRENDLFLLSFAKSSAKAPVHKILRINGQIPDAVIECYDQPSLVQANEKARVVSVHAPLTTEYALILIT